MGRPAETQGLLIRGGEDLLREGTLSVGWTDAHFLEVAEPRCAAMGKAKSREALRSALRQFPQPRGHLAGLLWEVAHNPPSRSVLTDEQRRRLRADLVATCADTSALANQLRVAREAGDEDAVLERAQEILQSLKSRRLELGRRPMPEGAEGDIEAASAFTHAELCARAGFDVLGGGPLVVEAAHEVLHWSRIWRTHLGLRYLTREIGGPTKFEPLSFQLDRHEVSWRGLLTALQLQAGKSLDDAIVAACHEALGTPLEGNPTDWSTQELLAEAGLVLLDLDRQAEAAEAFDRALPARARWSPPRLRPLCVLGTRLAVEFLADEDSDRAARYLASLPELLPEEWWEPDEEADPDYPFGYDDYRAERAGDERELVGAVVGREAVRDDVIERWLESLAESSPRLALSPAELALLVAASLQTASASRSQRIATVTAGAPGRKSQHDVALLARLAGQAVHEKAATGVAPSSARTAAFDALLDGAVVRGAAWPRLLVAAQQLAP